MGNIHFPVFFGSVTRFILEAPLVRHQAAGLIFLPSRCQRFHLSWKDACQMLVPPFPKSLWGRGKSGKLKTLECTLTRRHNTSNTCKVNNSVDYCNVIVSHNN